MDVLHHILQKTKQPSGCASPYSTENKATIWMCFTIFYRERSNHLDVLHHILQKNKVAQRAKK